MHPNLDSSNKIQNKTQAMIAHYHSRTLSPNQCGSVLVQTIDAPLPLVWSLVRRFDNPQAYKQFIRNCTMLVGDRGGGVGSIRKVEVISGLPAEVSLERLDELDDELHLIKFSIVDGDHRLVNYRSTTSLHEEEETGKTVAIESYSVDVPAGSSEEDTCSFTNTIISCNLKWLARTAEQMALNIKGLR
ncbi:hypothetical protein L6164_017457 [Bauhinia variegata]|uniref:Uncharacterized protein n=1 Tax=Bauhinia variegata TaxID=167791 RepID=A0ACB9N9A1_BAUVA|nr:hypothetical protein L6164_017457 [Bauhinia variegata]